MKKNKIIYITATSAFCLFMLFSAVNYFTNQDMPAIFTHLGFPQYFRIELGIAKLLGIAALAIPGIPSGLKEWAYAGFATVLISAMIAHAAMGDGAVAVSIPLVVLGVMIISYLSFKQGASGQR